MRRPAPDCRRAREFSLAGADCIVADGVCWLADRSALAGQRGAHDRSGAHDGECRWAFRCTKRSRWRARIPARALGLDAKGRLEAGADADFVVLSPELEVLQTFVAGERSFPQPECGAVADAHFVWRARGRSASTSQRKQKLRDIERRGRAAELADIRRPFVPLRGVIRESVLHGGDHGIVA